MVLIPDTSSNLTKNDQFPIKIDDRAQDLTRVDLIDARTGTLLCSVKPLDKAANADGQRRVLAPPATDATPPSSSGIAPLLRKLLADYAATGLPPAYLPPPDKDSP